MRFNYIKQNYDKGLWSAQMVYKAVEKKVITAEQYKEITGGNAMPNFVALTLEETIAAYETLIQQRLDDFARTLTYDGILSACTYATSNVEMYRVEGQYCVDARDRTWAAAYEIMSAILPLVQAGGAIPAWEDIEAQLPPLAWPAGSRGHAAEGGQ